MHTKTKIKHRTTTNNWRYIKQWINNNSFHTLCYNPFLVYCRELAPGTISLTGDRAQGDDSKHDSHYTGDFCLHCGKTTSRKLVWTHPEKSNKCSFINVQIFCHCINPNEITFRLHYILYLKTLKHFLVNVVV